MHCLDHEHTNSGAWKRVFSSFCIKERGFVFLFQKKNHQHWNKVIFSTSLAYHNEVTFIKWAKGSLSIDSITHLLYWQQQHTCSDHWSHVRDECHISCSLKTFIWTHTLYEWQKKALALKSQLLQKDPSTKKRPGSLACSPSFSQQTLHTELLSDTQEISSALQLQPKNLPVLQTSLCGFLMSCTIKASSLDGLHLGTDHSMNIKWKILENVTKFIWIVGPRPELCGKGALVCIITTIKYGFIIVIIIISY